MHKQDRAIEPPLLPENTGLGSITRRLSDLVVRQSAPLGFLAALWITGALTLMFFVVLVYLFTTGVGIFGVNIPVAWAFPIINTIWWIGIAHAGTLISAVLLLTRQRWRASINRFAEAMALFAIIQAGIYPLMHLGRPWFFYWILPYPNTMELWPQWRSPLVWDFFAIGTYMLYTMMFLYLSLLPDIGTLRDKAKGRIRYFYGVMALGWRNSARHWARYQKANVIFAAVAAPIVASVTGTISMDLSASIVPGYHFTIFPPYFVSGALLSGFATVIMLAVPLRAVFGLHDLVTVRHIDYAARLMLVFALIVDYSYMCEMFTAWYSGADYYRHVYIDRWTGPYAPFWWGMILCNVVLMQLLWFKRVRRSAIAMFCLGFVALLGMWLERYQILITSTHQDYMPSAWSEVWPTLWDWLAFAGSIGCFVFMFLIFVRLMPMISIHDMRTELAKERAQS